MYYIFVQLTSIDHSPSAYINPRFSYLIDWLILFINHAVPVCSVKDVLNRERLL
jgi:hypothetical protein